MSGADGLARMLARPIAHRGLHACGDAGPLENTIEAALAAVEAGYGIECDVRLSRDGIPLVFHDETLARLGGRSERIADFEAAEIMAMRLTGGFRIPTLDAFLAAIAGREALVIEIKSEGGDEMRFAAAIGAAIVSYAGPVALESFDPAMVSACEGAPCPVGLVGPGEVAIDVDALPRCDFVSWSVDRLDGRPPRLPCTTWTVRSPAQVAGARSAGAQIVFEGFRPAVPSR